MQTRNQTIIPLTRLDIQQMVLEAVKRLRVPLDEGVKKWDYDSCYDEAKKYKSLGEFVLKNSGAYDAASRNGWLKDYTWLERKWGKWDYDACYNEAKKYKSKVEFKKNNSSAYYKAVKNGWLDDYTWFERPVSHRKKWDSETCYNEAKKYKTLKDFSKNSKTAYVVASKNKWLDGYTWLERNEPISKNIYVVYYYENKETNAVYVGLTSNLKRRHKEHKTGITLHGNHGNDIVYKYFHDTLGKEVPEPIVLHKSISANDAREYEKQYVEKFKNEGKLVLNSAKAGSLGGLYKWSKKKCYDEAKKYKTRNEFRKKCGGAYNVARKNGWLNEYDWFKEITRKPYGYWNQETCFEEAKKYKSKIEFKRNNQMAYNIARKNGWLKDYTWFQRPSRSNQAALR